MPANLVKLFDYIMTMIVPGRHSFAFPAGLGNGGERDTEGEI